MRTMSLFILLCFGWGWAWSQTRSDPFPPWVAKKPAHTRSQRYYVGRSPSVSSEREALRAALEDARVLAIEENFGIHMKVDAESLETLTDAKLSKRTESKSALVNLRSFEVREQYTSHEGDRFIAYVLCEYPVGEIATEKARLRRLIREAEREQTLSEVGESSGRTRGEVEVRTVPSGVEVKVDHRSWGKTPVRIRGLPEGEHLLDLFHPEYDPEMNESFLVITGKTVQIKKTLKRREIKIQVRSEPEGAIVSVNGKVIDGSTPNGFSALLGDAITIGLSHPEANPASTKLKVEDGIELPVFNLIYKPATVLLDSFPTGAEVYLDGKRSGTTGDRVVFPTARGKHEIKLVKKGFVDDEFTVELRGGENKVLPTRKLESISAEQIRKKEEEAREEFRRKERREEERLESLAKEHEIAATYPDRFWYIGFGYGGKSSTVPILDSKKGFCCILIPIGFQWRIYRTFYIRAEYDFGLGTDEIQNGSYSWDTESKYILVHDFNFGVPVYDGSFRIGPEGGVQINSYPVPGGKFDQTFYGLSVGFDHLRFRDSGVGFALKIRNYSKPSPFEGGVYVLGAFTFGAVVRD
ncbi:MAG: PEGA domain-containing protein [Proteobacteria bacterium]|nr:PEGA domain-containing protein [Pseudomonadota bacterium]